MMGKWRYTLELIIMCYPLTGMRKGITSHRSPV